MAKASIKHNVILLTICILGLFLRLYHIEFGLPHSFYGDEPEITEPAIKYTYELVNIVKSGDYYKLIPVSFVYGTFPTYFLTVATMVFSKTNNLLGVGFDKLTLFIFLRVVTAIVSFLLIPISYCLYLKLFKSRAWAIVCATLVALNWKLIVHAHYVNQDTFLAVLVLASVITLVSFYEKPSDTFYTGLTAVFFGLAVGTKITALITLPLYLYIFIKKASWKNLLAFCLIAFAVFALTNPFSLIFANDFIYRIAEMLTKEGGLVFDSVNTSLSKYIYGIALMITPMLFAISLYGIIIHYNRKLHKTFDIFLILTIITYFIFYTIQSRRVDRWLLPTLPLLIMYATFGLSQIVSLVKSKVAVVLAALMLLITYLYYPMLLLKQFERYTPKAQAYIWIKENISEFKTKLMYTEEGLDPINKVPLAHVVQYNVYESENAQYFLPENPNLYDYVIISSRTMENFKKPQVKEKYPFYIQRWEDYEKTVLDSTKFELVKDFTLPKPNLIPLSDVYIYKNLKTSTQ